MNRQRITANLPKDLLKKAQEVSGKGITETIIEGLKKVRQSHAYEMAKKMRGRLKLNIDIEESRERHSR